jgi:hypothetical protein
MTARALSKTIVLVPMRGASSTERVRIDPLDLQVAPGREAAL